MNGYPFYRRQKLSKVKKYAQRLVHVEQADEDVEISDKIVVGG